MMFYAQFVPGRVFIFEQLSCHIAISAKLEVSPI